MFYSLYRFPSFCHSSRLTDRRTDGHFARAKTALYGCSAVEMMTHCYSYLQIYYFFFSMSLLGRENKKITLTFSYYFRIGRPEQFHQKSSD